MFSPPPPPRSRPEPLPVAAGDLKGEIRATGREFAVIAREMGDMFGWMLRETGKALRYTFRNLYQELRNPATSQKTLIALTRALLRINIFYGAILIAVMPIGGAPHRVWEFVLGMTVVLVAIEMIWSGNWFGGAFKPKKVSLIKAPRP